MLNSLRARARTLREQALREIERCKVRRRSPDTTWIERMELEKRIADLETRVRMIDMMVGKSRRES